jgi:filamentous hemagglutinin family protein
VTSPTSGGFQIDGGATRGTNLFHSFQEFSIPTNGSAYFNNALTIENIITRVTGASVSNIDGEIRANGTANVFLINPNGITFGSNASLNMGGSFLVSTARELVFDNGFEFSATNPQAPPLLTVNVPLGLQYGSNAGSIQAQGSFLQVPDGKTLAFVGGEVALEGSILYAPDGRIELGSVAENSQMSLTPTPTGYTLSYGGVGNFQDIRLMREAFVVTKGDSGGSIQVQGRNVTLTDGSQIQASVLRGGKGGGLSVNASESVQVLGTSADGQSPSGLGVQASRTAAATAEVGDVTITTKQLLIQDGALVTADTFGAGKGGNLIVNASESVHVIGTSAGGEFSSRLSASGARKTTGVAGNLSITTPRLFILGGAVVTAGSYGDGKGGILTVNASQDVQVSGTSADGQISSALSTQAQGTGDAGDLNITTSRLLISDGAQVSASTFGVAKGGNLIVNASESLRVIGTSADGQLFSNLTAQAGPNSTGDAGDMSITTARLLILGGAQVGTGTFGAGKGGNLTVNASEQVQLIGESADGRLGSSLATQAAPNPNSTGDAGDMSITTTQLLILGGAQVSAGTFGTGKGGNLTVYASQDVQLIGTSADGHFPSGLFVSAEAGSTAGNLTVKTGKMSVRDGAEVGVSSTRGQAGNMTITADFLTLNRGRIFAVTGKSTAGEGANITLRGLDLLRMDNESLISANAFEDANGGNVKIDSTFIVATPPKGPLGSDITANAVRGNGGRVNVTTQGLFGIEFRPKLTPNNDITASSDFGIAGEVAINTPDVDPSRGLANLPTELTDASNQIAQTCPTGGKVVQNEFIVTGRGGLPDAPDQTLIPDAVWTDLRPTPQTDKTRSSSPEAKLTHNSKTAPLVEATGWAINGKGEVVLTASAPNVTPQSPTLTPITCPTW